MSDWQIFFWAALHHPDFQSCYIQPPITLRCDWHEYSGSWELRFSILFWAQQFHLPHSVQDAHYKAHSSHYKAHSSIDTFDDILF